ncbi:MAG: sulfatase [Methanosarcinaceae archaeon]|nr:sulfatase [Methanosarcinaceae archaeon]
MDRRYFLKMVGAGLAALSTASGSSVPLSGDAAKKKPNIVFLLIDDQRNDTLGCAGHPIIKTPVIDDLAKKGVRFSNAFVTTSICAASRASILTGLHERTTRFTFNTPPMLQEQCDVSYPVLLRQAGYRTGFIGKFGVKVPKGVKENMFDNFIEIGGNPYFRKQADGSLRHESEVAGDHAIKFLEDNPSDKPFCLSISFNAVHAEDGDKRPGIGHFPWPKAVDGMYDDIEIPPPRLNDPAIFESQPEFLKKSMNRDRYYWRWDTPEKYQKNMKAYYRMISGVDHVIGRIRDALKENKLADNTIIIYMGDNGYYMGDRGFAGKWSHYEQSLRVPFIVYDPRLSKEMRGKVKDQMALNIDAPATMLDFAGIDIPKHYQGTSLAPIVKGESLENWRKDFFCEHLMDNAAIPKWEGVRGKRYVYARYFENDYEFLHDLKKDPDQLKNLAGSKEHGETLQIMRNRCDELMNKYGGPYKPYPKPEKKKISKGKK